VKVVLASAMEHIQSRALTILETQDANLPQSYCNMSAIMVL